MRPIFADPKTDFIFKRIFGSEPHKHLLIELLNTLLELEGDRRRTDLCELIGIEMTDEHREVIAAANWSKLETLREGVKRERRWPVS